MSYHNVPLGVLVCIVEIVEGVLWECGIDFEGEGGTRCILARGVVLCRVGYGGLGVCCEVVSWCCVMLGRLCGCVVGLCCLWCVVLCMVCCVGVLWGCVVVLCCVWCVVWVASKGCVCYDVPYSLS